jgi:phenylalanyl-tRNA synthetase alpha chain
VNDINSIVQEAHQAIQQTEDLASLDHLRVKYLGKKGALTNLLKNLSTLDPSERPQYGQQVNQAKQQLQQSIQQQQSILEEAHLQSQLSQETLDVTLPGRGQSLGNLHPITQIRTQVESFFSQLGFSIADGPEVEDDYHNFEALNIPANHPARDMQDTFYLENGLLLRTHTSPVQIRVMQQQEPPLRILAPGRVYRCDDIDPTHSPMFNQVEGLLVDEDINFAHLKGILEAFVRFFFAEEIQVRFRPSFFPFTEPSAELDVLINGRWMEILGCGMVHPNVLENVNIDSEKYTGFAFGMGFDRLAMARFGIDDLRLFFESDLRFLGQF